MSLQTFKEALKLMLLNVISMFANVKEATGASMSFVHKSIMRYIGSLLPQQDRYIFDVPIISFTSGLGPSFGKLPRELRDQVFSDLIASGHPQFMGVSRVMNAEGKALNYKKGVFRMRFDFDVSKKELAFRKRPLPAANIVDNIENLSIRVRSRPDLSYLHMRIFAKAFSRFRMFRDYPLTHGNCTVVFDIASYRATTLLWGIAHSLEGFKNFDTVVMRMDFDLDAASWVSEKCHAVMQADFKPYLGQGDLGSDSDGLCVIFHPRKAQRKSAVGEM